ncbi:uncharacterized protein LOC131953821 [Physella acuta]|uniref:uncharacterized protein LOC131953821 n=1 Tax=Physella acuta TaxID=109671 RepID=UPI0027DB32F3|nr:uncharacterized protein LOC131953821 [Physella acuta]
MMYGYLSRRIYSRFRNWTFPSEVGKMCYEDLQCEEACCHDLEFGMPYCCSKYLGFIYLGLMVGGGVIIAVLVIACYMCLTKTERELEAAAKLERAKASNARCNVQQLNDHNDRTPTINLNLPPPAYNDVLQTLSRFYGSEAGVSAREIRSDTADQHSQGFSSQPMLQSMVDIPALIARHRLQHSEFQHSCLPPMSSPTALENKLPTYEECTAIVGNHSPLATLFEDNGCDRSIYHKHDDNAGNSSGSNKFSSIHDAHFLDITETMRSACSSTDAGFVHQNVSNENQLPCNSRSKTYDVQYTITCDAENDDVHDSITKNAEHAGVSDTITNNLENNGVQDTITHETENDFLQQPLTVIKGNETVQQTNTCGTNKQIISLNNSHYLANHLFISEVDNSQTVLSESCDNGIIIQARANEIRLTETDIFTNTFKTLETPKSIVLSTPAESDS